MWCPLGCRCPSADRTDAGWGVLADAVMNEGDDLAGQCPCRAGRRIARLAFGTRAGTGRMVHVHRLLSRDEDVRPAAHEAFTAPSLRRWTRLTNSSTTTPGERSIREGIGQSQELRDAAQVPARDERPAGTASAMSRRCLDCGAALRRANADKRCAACGTRAGGSPAIPGQFWYAEDVAAALA